MDFEKVVKGEYVETLERVKRYYENLGDEEKVAKLAARIQELELGNNR